MASYQTPLTLANCRSLVRNLILERAADVGLVTDSELNELINFSSRNIWLRIATKYPDAFAIRSTNSMTVTAGTNSVSFATIAASNAGNTAGGGNVFRILNALTGPVGTAEPAMEQIHELDKVSSRHVYEPGVGGTPTGLVAQPAIPYRWYVEGQNLFFSPQCTGAYDVRVQWTQQPKDMTADGDIVWEGQLAMYHDTVCALAAVTAETKDGMGTPAANIIFTMLDQSLNENFGLPRYPLHDAPRTPYSETSKNSRP
jgi:hypothetical protein